MRFLYLAFIIVCLCACTSTPRETIEEYNVDVPLACKHPGALFYRDGIVTWQEMRSPINFIHFMDSTGKDIAQHGAIGKFQNDFISVSVSQSYNGHILLNDMKKLYQQDCYLIGDSVAYNESRQFFMNAFSVTEMKSGVYLLNTIYDSIPLLVYDSQTKTKTAFGENPVKGTYTNMKKCFANSIIYNPVKDCILCQYIKFPNVILYQSTGNGFTKKELKKPYKYKVDLKKNLVVDEKMLNPYYKCAMSKDYILIQQFDEEFSGPQQRELKVDKMPRCFFVYNYNFELLKIVTLKGNIVRLTADVESNKVYAIVLCDGEYRLVSFDLHV